MMTLEHTEAVAALAYAPDGQTLAVGCDDGTIRAWSPKGTALFTLWGHRRTVRGLVFSGPENTGLLFSGSDDDPPVRTNRNIGLIRRRNQRRPADVEDYLPVRSER